MRAACLLRQGRPRLAWDRRALCAAAFRLGHLLAALFAARRLKFFQVGLLWQAAGKLPAVRASLATDGRLRPAQPGLALIWGIWAAGVLLALLFADDRGVVSWRFGLGGLAAGCGLYARGRAQKAVDEVADPGAGTAASAWGHRAAFVLSQEIALLAPLAVLAAAERLLTRNCPRCETRITRTLLLCVATHAMLTNVCDYFVWRGVREIAFGREICVLLAGFFLAVLFPSQRLSPWAFAFACAAVAASFAAHQRTHSQRVEVARLVLDAQPADVYHRVASSTLYNSFIIAK